MKVLALVFAAFLAGCSLGPPAPPASEDMREVKFWHDVARGVGCWIWYGSGRGGIACLPDSQYTTPQGSASRSAPEYRESHSSMSPAAPVAQGRSGAPTSAVPRSPSEAEQRDVAAESHRAGFPETPASQGWSGANVGAPLFAQTHIGTAAGAIRGVASYYPTGSPGIAAAGPNLRAALGRDWRGTWVRVSYRGRSAWLRLGDACWCNVADIDIPTRTFSYLSRDELWRGLLRVTITWGDVPRLPATSTDDGWKP